jgi:hypothetical protein
MVLFTTLGVVHLTLFRSHGLVTFTVSGTTSIQNGIRSSVSLFGGILGLFVGTFTVTLATVFVLLLVVDNICLLLLPGGLQGGGSHIHIQILFCNSSCDEEN